MITIIFQQLNQFYIYIQRQWRRNIASKLKIEFIEVESNVVVPVETASNKEEFAARTIRPKIQNNLPQFLKEISKQQLKVDKDLKFFESNIPDYKNLEILDLTNLKQTLEKLNIDRTVPKVATFEGGQSNATQLLTKFCQSGLKSYDKSRNMPQLSLKSGSNMSPYLHFGHISPIQIALAIKKQNVKQEDKERYLEEMIVRRELSMNMCHFNHGYDQYEKVLPEFAKKTLKDHINDKREYVYTFDEFEAGCTHDDYWNAAQLEMVATGKMQGYMRMYWGKKILEWMEDPKEAFQTAIRLNDKYELDGRDPNGFTGIAWCFGKHDQGWTEREIFGKVRFMNAQGLKRKFDMSSYIEVVKSHIKNYGLPEHIKALRALKKIFLK